MVCRHHVRSNQQTFQRITFFLRQFGFKPLAQMMQPKRKEFVKVKSLQTCILVSHIEPCNPLGYLGLAQLNSDLIALHVLILAKMCDLTVPGTLLLSFGND